MKNITTKVDGTSTLPANAFNSMASELENAVTVSGQVLDNTSESTPDPNPTQLGRSISIAALTVQTYNVVSLISNVYTIAPKGAWAPPSGYVDGQTYRFKATANSAGATSVDVNGLGPVTLKKPDGNDIAANDLVQDAFYSIVYDAASGFFVVSSVVVGGLQVSIKSTSFVAQVGYVYLVDTTAGVVNATLPPVDKGGALRIVDGVGNFPNNNCNILPATGEKIRGLSINAPKTLAALGAGADFYSDTVNGQWAYNEIGASSGGSGSGGINYITNPDAESNTAGWASYADAAGPVPVDGTGGTPTVTFTRNTVSPLRGGADFKFSKPASNCQGQGFSSNFSISVIDRNKKLQMTVDLGVSAANYTAGDMAFFVYDVTGAALIPVSVAPIPKIVGHWILTFDTTASLNYRLIGHVATVNALAYDLFFDNWSVNPGNSYQVPAIGDWTDYPSTPANQGMGTPTFAKAKYVRVGPSVFLDVQVAAGTPSGTELRVGLPPGTTVGGAGQASVGTWRVDNGIATSAKGGHVVTLAGNNYVTFTVGEYTTTNNPYSAPVSGNVVFNSTPGRTMGFTTTAIPIAEWAGSGVNIGQNAQPEFAADDGTSDVFGPNGALVPNVGAGTGVTSREFTFSTPQSATDLYLLEYNFGGNGWTEASIYPYISGNANYVYGVRAYWANATTLRVQFGNGGNSPGNGLGAAAASGLLWSAEFAVGSRFRVRKASAGSAVGFGLATATESGLVSGGKVPGAPATTGVLANSIGENQQLALATLDTVSSGVAVTNSVTMSLTEGTWEIGYDVSVVVVNTAAGASGVFGNLFLYNNTAAVAINNTAAVCGIATGNGTAHYVPASRRAFITVSVPTIISLRMACNASAAAGKLNLPGTAISGALPAPNNSQTMWARRL